MTIELEVGDVRKLVLDARARGGFELEVHDGYGGPLTTAILSHEQVRELRAACDRVLELFGDAP